MSARLNWRGAAVRAAIANRIADGLTEIDQRIETFAKAELYPGHGKRSGNLQRSIFGDKARVAGNRAVGRVGSRGVRYALRLHERYRYIIIGVEKVRPLAPGIIRRHAGK